MSSGVVVLQLMVYRFRRVYFLFCGYVLFLILLAHFPKTWIADPVAGLLCVPFVLGLLATVFGFVNMEADIASPASAFSPWLLRLPLKTTSLVFWPMAAAAIWGSLSWAVFSACYLRPRGIVAPIGWPAANFAALSLSLQAVLWVPVRHGAVRLLVAITVTLTIALFGVIAMSLEMPEGQITAAYLAVSAVSVLVGWVGLIRARTSPTSRRQRSVDAVATGSPPQIGVRKPAFKSPQSAQFWLEWRRQGRLLPILTAFGLFAMSVPMFVYSDTEKLSGSETIRVNIWMVTALPYLPWIPLLFATVIGMGARPSDLRGNDGVYHLYHATRPLSATELFGAKIRSITAGIMLTAAITIGVILIWICIPNASDKGKPVSYLSTFIGMLHYKDWVAIVGFGLALIAWAWRNQAVGAFVDYVPSRKMAQAYPVVVVFTFVALLCFAGEIGNTLRGPNGHSIASCVLGSIFALKMGFASAFAWKTFKLRPSSRGELIGSVVWWLVIATIAATAVGLIVNAMPSDAIYPNFQSPVPELLAVLLVPLVRPMAARIALEYGRHR